MTFSLSYGYGMVDAFAAVRMAEVWTTLYGAAQTSANEQSVSVSYSGSSETIPDRGSAEISVNVTDSISIEHVYVTIRCQHSDISELTLELIAPDGTAYRLFHEDSYSNDYFSGDYTFGVTGLRGTTSDGTWTVRATDNTSGSSGRLYDVDLDFHGSTATNDTVYHFTQDYFTSLALVETDRRVLTDTDGGIDWLNLVALTSHVRLMLTDNSTISFSGQTITVTLTNGSAFENVAFGDGNDIANGSSADNHLLGGRGNDKLAGQGGSDRLEGGAGDDDLRGDGLIVSSLTDAQTIYRLYQATLDRVPDALGLLYWEEQLASSSLEAIVGGFTGSVEFQTRFSVEENEDFVTLLYNNVLNRDPDASGLASWVGLLESGTQSREQVVLGFSESREFRLGTDESSSAYVSSGGAQAWTDDVFRLYQAVFDRLPDVGGHQGWMQALASGVEYKFVVEQFISSAEFQLSYGDADNESFVTLLYNNVLNRDPDAGGFASWLGLLDSGDLDRADVVAGFAQSVEFIGSTVGSLIDFMRGQAVDDTLVGGAGNNTLYGGAGRDSFVFTQTDNNAQSVIADFESWDAIDLTALGYQSIQDLTLADSASGATIQYGFGTITLAGWEAADLTADHFIF